MLILFLVLITVCDARSSSDPDFKINLEEVKNIIREQNERIGQLEEGWKELQMENIKLKVIIGKQQSDISELKTFKFEIENMKTKSQDSPKSKTINKEQGKDKVYLRGQLKTKQVVNIPISSKDGSFLAKKHFHDGQEENPKLDNTSGNESTDSDVKVNKINQKEVNFHKDKRLLLPTPTISSATVAFYAYMSKTEANIGPHHTLIFDHPETNIGNAYNNHSGIFTALTAGVYMFSYTAFPDVSSLFAIEITVNSAGKGSVFIYRTSNGGLYGSTGNAILFLNKGDVCFIRTQPSYTGDAGSIVSDTPRRSSFSGFKISA